jgi:ATP-dependent protease ClpP protease subunit
MSKLTISLIIGTTLYLLALVFVMDKLKADVKTSTLVVKSDRLVKILGRIDASIIEQANVLTNLTKKKGDIFLMVNSPGGNVLTGSIFIDSMKNAQARGIKIRCFSTVYAASMAFSILMACDSVSVFANTKLLFHPSRVNSRMPLTAPVLDKLYARLEEIDDKIIKTLKTKLNYNEEIEEAFYEEKFWSAEDLLEHVKGDWLKITNITGVDDMFSYTTIMDDSNEIEDIEIVN